MGMKDLKNQDKKGKGRFTRTERLAAIERAVAAHWKVPKVAEQVGIPLKKFRAIWRTGGTTSPVVRPMEDWLETNGFLDAGRLTDEQRTGVESAMADLAREERADYPQKRLMFEEAKRTTAPRDPIIECPGCQERVYAYCLGRPMFTCGICGADLGKLCSCGNLNRIAAKVCDSCGAALGPPPEPPRKPKPRREPPAEKPFDWK